ncbi:MAG: ABC transporter substrate-binding protein [Defluviitaleaceae bacterium]|nr:ABC transporter substrate-binding protein [Defluviitaleaceae bacterium]MCL2224915.1 ABC transporter substrate-binding protein [Defluviitaleaceae bacterium]MCL2262523.1 ABC transporter substrate-binding protein [Defluviitaleaceae bacterium]
MKFVLMLMVSALLMAGFVACSDGNESAPAAGGDTAADTAERTFQIGVIQLSEHPALVAAQDGFMAAIEYYGVPAVFDVQNALGDRDVLPTIADRHVNNNVDLILAIATPSVQAMFAATNEIPIVGSAITSYERAGVVASNEAPGYNVTGASDMNPIQHQINMIFDFVPDMEILGIAYASGEPNAVYQAELAIAYAESLGLEVITGSVTTVGEVQQNILSLATRADAIWLPTDNTHADSMPIVGQVAIETGIPVFPGEDMMVMGGGLATLSINYFELGFESGRMARDILIYGADPAEMPIRFGMDLNLNYIINGFMAEELGIEVPAHFADYVWFPE